MIGGNLRWCKEPANHKTRLSLCWGSERIERFEHDYLKAIFEAMGEVEVVTTHARHTTRFWLKELRRTRLFTSEIFLKPPAMMMSVLPLNALVMSSTFATSKLRDTLLSNLIPEKMPHVLSPT